MMPTDPGPSRRPVVASSLLLAIALGLSASALSGCVGGASERDPRGSVASEKKHWVFPLYHYSRADGRKTIRPLFLFPISYGGGDAEVASTDGFDDDRLSGGEAPLWRDGAPAGGARQPEAVQPGVWGSSLPQGSGTTAVDGGAGGGREHEVRAGETLYAIARRYYGTGAEWPKIADANRDRVPSPQSLPIGARLRIP